MKMFFSPLVLLGLLLIAGCGKPAADNKGNTTAGGGEAGDAELKLPEIDMGSEAGLGEETPPPTANDPEPGTSETEEEDEPSEEGEPSEETENGEDNPTAEPALNETAIPVDPAASAQIKPGDWPQWGGTSYRNNTPIATGIPTEWEIGGFDRKTGEWQKEDAQNIKWVAALGSQSYGNPVVAGGKVFVGTNNSAGYLQRYPSHIDLGCLLCFDEKTGEFLWQHSSEKLPTGRVHDWPLQGICCAPYVEGDRLWFVSSQGHVICLDIKGYYDDEDNGPVISEKARLFSVSPLVQNGLNEGEVSDALRSQFKASGAELSQRVFVDVVEEDKKWTLTTEDRDEESDETSERKFEVSVSGTMLTASQIGEEGNKEVFSTDTRLAAGLDDGAVSGLLKQQFADSGMELPEEIEIKTETAGKKWALSAKVNDADREVSIFMQGPNLTAFKVVTTDDKQEADTIWAYDMMQKLGVSQHNMCSCSITAYGDIIFVNTSNGLDESHINLPAPDAPSFIAMNKDSGEVLWTDKSPGTNILHGQWSSPTVAEIGGSAQVIFGGGDGWVYSFKADAGVEGKPELLWKFDANPKESKWVLGGRGTRNNIIATPVVHEGLVYVAVGQDPEHGEGIGHLWCIDPTKRGDVSAQLAVQVDDRSKVIPHKRIQAVVPEEGEVAIDNPNSAVVWHYSEFDQNGDGEIDFEETMHRSCGTVAIKNDLLYIADFSGLFHCLDAKTGKVNWTYDMLAAAWGSPLIVEDHVYIGDEDGDVAIFELSAEQHEPLAEINMENCVYSTPIVANGVLFIANKTHLFAIEAAGAE